MGNVTRIEDPDAGESVSYYDGAGNLVSTLNARDQQRIYDFDELDRLTAITTPTPGEADYTITYAPGELGQGGEAGPGYTKALSYDTLGRLETETRFFSGGNMRITTEYDLLGRRTSVNHSGLGNPITYEYAGAFLTRVCKHECDQTGYLDIIAGVTYDHLGRRATLGFPGGTRTFGYSSDVPGEDEDERHLKSDAFAGLESTTVFYLDHDPLGNVTQWQVDSPHVQVAADGSYAYDERNRLVAWERNEIPHSYGYDPLGNLIDHEGSTQEFAGPTPHAISGRSGPTGVDPATYSHDASGNLEAIDRELLGDDRWYAFDSANRLVCASSTAAEDCDVLEVFYDASGTRIREVAGDVTRRFLGDEQIRTYRSEGMEQRAEIFAFGERVAYQEKLPSQSPEAPPIVAFGHELPPWLLGLLPLAGLVLVVGLTARGELLVGIARRPARAGVAWATTAALVIVPVPGLAGGGGSQNYYRWILSDRLGSSVTEVDQDGAIVRQVRFRPFGGIDPGASYEAGLEPGTPRRYYAGHPRQEETGLTYMKARWMDPETGTFLSVDPITRLGDPQRMNGYSYANDNPVGIVDPTGMEGIPRSGIGRGGSIISYSVGNAGGDTPSIPAGGHRNFVTPSELAGLQAEASAVAAANDFMFFNPTFGLPPSASASSQSAAAESKAAYASLAERVQGLPSGSGFPGDPPAFREVNELLGPVSPGGLPRFVVDQLQPFFPGENLFNISMNHGIPWWSAGSPDAVTFGNSIYFGAGQYSPGTVGGLALIGHEITHVAQFRAVGAFGFSASYLGQYAAGRLSGLSAYSAYRGISFEASAFRQQDVIFNALR